MYFGYYGSFGIIFVILEVSEAFSSLQMFQRHFGHSSHFGVFLALEEIDHFDFTLTEICNLHFSFNPTLVLGLEQESG